MLKYSAKVAKDRDKGKETRNQWLEETAVVSLPILPEGSTTAL